MVEILIPKQLQKIGYRFCKIETKSKAPFEQQWQSINNYSFENKELLELNFKLMQLKEVDILPSTKLKIMDILNSPINQLNKLQFMKMLAHDRIENSIPQFNVWVSETCALLEMTARSFNHDLKK